MFTQAIALLEPLYDAAVIHVFAERESGTWHNRYTSVCYGFDADLASVPLIREEKVQGEHLALRVKLPLEEARAFVKKGAHGSAKLGESDISYDLESPIVGFRPATSFNDFTPQSLCGGSIWTREYIGRLKRMGTSDLETAWWKLDIALAFLNEVRWSPIPLRDFPEKLGDLDEWWPTPIELTSRKIEGGIGISVARDKLNVSQDRIRIDGVLMRDGLQVGRVSVSGKGPHTIDTAADAADLTLSVDGIPFDESAGVYIKQVLMRMNVATGETWQVPAFKGRPPMEFPFGTTTSQEIPTRTPEAASVRTKFWHIGRQLRASASRADAERVYDPDADSSSVQNAFSDLRSLGSHDHRPRIAVVDPYALNESALQAIVVSATREGRAESVDIYTTFEPPPGTSAKAITGSVDTARAQEQKAATATAEKLAKKAGIKIRFYRVQHLHDRFLIIGGRIWHVGPSFNKLGEAFSALVEMRDPRQVARIHRYLDRAVFIEELG